MLGAWPPSDPLIGQERNAEPGQHAWSADGIYCAEGFLSFKALRYVNNNSHTFVGVDIKKAHPNQNPQETMWGELEVDRGMHTMHEPEPEQAQQGERPS